MASELKLPWVSTGDDDAPQWEASAGPFGLKAAQFDVDAWAWLVSAEHARFQRDGTADTLLAAQLAAEAAALAWLSEGVAAFGGRVLEAGAAHEPGTPRPDAPLDVAALPDWWDEQRRLDGKPDASTCGAELRRALAGGRACSTLARWSCACRTRAA